MSYRREFTIEKSPGEVRTFTVQFETEDPTLPDPILIGAVVTAQDDADGSDTSSIVLDGGATAFEGKEVTFRVHQGISGKRYKISVVATLTNGDVWIADGTLKVSES
jgi:hypothetical protein